FFNVGWPQYSMSCWLNSDTIINPHNAGHTQVVLNTTPAHGLAIDYNFLLDDKYSVWAGKVPSAAAWDILTDAPSRTSVTAHPWVHLALVKESGANYLLYINGLLDTAFTGAATASNYYCKLIFGRSDSSASDQTFLGSLDDFGIWNRTLAPCEI